MIVIVTGVSMVTVVVSEPPKKEKKTNDFEPSVSSIDEKVTRIDEI
jgi:hypothetical protein